MMLQVPAIRSQSRSPRRRLIALSRNEYFLVESHKCSIINSYGMIVIDHDSRELLADDNASKATLKWLPAAALL